MLKFLRRTALVLAVLSVLLTVLAVTNPQGRTAAKAGGFILQVIPAIPMKPLEWFTGRPIKEEVFFPQAQGQGVADLYRPGGIGERAAVLLFLGVNPAGRDDERVVNLAEGLARSGMVVMVPWSETMTQYRIDPAEVDNLVNAFQYLRMGYASAMAWILFVIILLLTMVQLKLAPRWVHYEGGER